MLQRTSALCTKTSNMHMPFCANTVIHTVNIDNTDNKDQYQPKYKVCIVHYEGYESSYDNVFIFQPLVHINVKVIWCSGWCSLFPSGILQ